MSALLRRRGVLLANLAVLLVLVLGMYHVGVNILRLQLGRDSYTISVQLREAGGLFPRSEVTYRGKLVGKVTDIELRPGGVLARARIDGGTEIPADLDAVVANLSAAGEQFLDLRPRRDGGPFLRAGSVIPLERTTTPTATATVIANLARVLDQVDGRNLTTVVTELALALDGSGPRLARLVTDSQALLATLTDTLPQTQRLLRSARTNLATANALAPDFEQFTRSLRTLSRTLRETDPTLRGLLDDAPGAIADIDTVLTTLTSPVSALLGNLITPGELITARLPALKGLLIAFPEATSALRTTVADGRFRISLHLTGNPTCDYDGTRRSPIDPKRVPPDLSRTCTSTEPGVGGRGAQNAPRSSPSGPASQASTPVALGSYDARTGVVALPDGTRVALGPVRSDASLSGAIMVLMALIRP